MLFRILTKPERAEHNNWLAALSLLVLLSLSPGTSGQQRQPNLTGPVVVNGYPEFHVEGKPFFPYAAGFFYHRIPVDLWAPSLVKLKEMGFNTLDLYVIWNWHQPTEAVIDLDGRTNPRRNLKHLLELAQSMGFKVILRPGPYTFNEWRNGGYPDWVMRKPGFQISSQAITEGWFPIASSLQYMNSEEAAQLWLDNETHWKYSAKWFVDLWKVAGPFSASRGGPVLTVQIDDDLAIGYYNYNGPSFWRYIQRNQRILAEAGVDVPLFTNAAFMRDTASANEPTGASPLWIIGQWYLRGGTPRLEKGDVAGLQFSVELLKTQPKFPPMMIEFNTNQYAGPKETHAQIIAPPRDMLLAARVLYQNGMRGNTIYPVQDTLFPAGWEFPPANYHYAWESALDISLNERPERAWALKRDGDLIAGMGSLLAATHEQADVGLVYPLTAYPQEGLRREEMNESARRLIKLQQLAYHAGISTQYIDLAAEPFDHLSRYEVVMLPSALFHKAAAKDAPLGEPLEMSAAAQRKLLDYVRNGGTLVVLPELPTGKALKELFPLASVGSSPAVGKGDGVSFANGSRVRTLGSRLRFEARDVPGVEPVAFEPEAKAVTGYRYRFDKGQVFVLGFDFFGWVSHAPVPTVGNWVSKKEELTADEQHQALQVLDWLLHEAGAQRNATPLIKGADPLDEFLYTTFMVANDGGDKGYGFVAATNWTDAGRRSGLRVADPRGRDPITLPEVFVPGRDSVFLPVRIPLNALVERGGRGGGVAPNEELIYSTAEVTAARFANRILTLDLYAPDSSEIALRLNNAPLGNVLSGSEVLRAAYDADQVLRITVPPGTAPYFRRSVSIPYFPLKPILNLQAQPQVLPGETIRVKVALNNPGEQPLAGQVVIEVPRGWPQVPSQEIRAGSGAQPLPGTPPGQTLEFQVPVPKDTVAGSDWNLRVCLDGAIETCSEPLKVRVTEPLSWHLSPQADFPLRDDVSLKTLPPLAAVILPGQTKLDLQLENQLAQQVEAKLEFAGESLVFEADNTSVQLPVGKAVHIPLTVWPRPAAGAQQTATGLYPFTIRVRTVKYTAEIPARVVGIRKGEALAYWYDFDRDGFADLVLENENLRAIVMPNAGGRAFALIDKTTGRNATDTVGGLRDAFSKNPPTYTWKNENLRRPPWRWPELMMHNREAAVRVVRTSGSEVVAELTYRASDVYPDGASVRKTLTLSGVGNMLLVDYEIEPRRGDPEQSFSAGFSTQIAGQLRPGAEFLLPKLAGVASRTFGANKTFSLGPDELSAGWFAASDPDSGDLLGIFWQGADQVVVGERKFSTLIEVVSPPLAQAKPIRFRLGYCFTRNDIDAMRRSYELFAKIPR